MRSRVTRQRRYLWARPTADQREPWPPGADYDRVLTGAVYDLPESEQLTLSGPRPEQGLILVLPAEHELCAGDLIRPVSDPARRYTVTEVRRYLGHVEAAAKRIPDEEVTE